MELIHTTSGDISMIRQQQLKGRWEKTTAYTTTLVPPTTSFTSVTITTGTSSKWGYDAGGTPSSSTGSTRCW